MLLINVVALFQNKTHSYKLNITKPGRVYWGRNSPGGWGGGAVIYQGEFGQVEIHQGGGATYRRNLIGGNSPGEINPGES